MVAEKIENFLWRLVFLLHMYTFKYFTGDRNTYIKTRAFNLMICSCTLSNSSIPQWLAQYSVQKLFTCTGK